MNEECTVAITYGARPDGMNCPRWRVTLESFPKRACAAVVYHDQIQAL